MTEERDVMLDQIVSALRPLPSVDDAAKARVLIAVAAERQREREDAARRAARGGRRRWTGAAASLAAAAALAAVLLRSPAPAPAVAPAAVASAPEASGGARLAASDVGADADAVRQQVQLVFRAPTASSVRVVGDFNAWDAERAPMNRDEQSGLWSVTLSLLPGRHVYAFVVDDSLWVRDPRAPAAKDADFGRPGSVLLVGRP